MEMPKGFQEAMMHIQGLIQMQPSLPHVDIDLDASPWGLGGILRVGGVFVSYFADELTQHDYSKYTFF